MGFQRLLGIVRSKYLPAGSYGSEVSALFVNAFSVFRSAVARAVWSSFLALTNIPALLSLLDGPWGSDPAFFSIWSRFRQLRRYLAYKSEEVRRICRLLDYASIDSLGHGPTHLLTESAMGIGYPWDSQQEEGWIRACRPSLRTMAEPVRHFHGAVGQAWHDNVAYDLCQRKGFRGEHCFDIYGSHQLLAYSHQRERDKMLLQAI